VDLTDSGIRRADAVTDAAASPVPWFRFSAVRLLVIRVPGPVRQGMLALAAYLAVFIVRFGLPLVSHLGVPQLRQYWTDPNFYTWAMRW
jgi:hypothetical protein